MRKLLHNLRRCLILPVGMWIFPMGNSLFTTNNPESDGFIMSEEGTYMFSNIFQRYICEDSINSRTIGEAYYIIDLPGDVTDYHLFRNKTLIFFEDGSAMEISTWYLEGGKFYDFVIDNKAVEQFDRKTLTDYLEEWMLRQHMDNLIIQCNPDDWIEPYASYYRAKIYRDKLLEDIKSDSYDRLNFKVCFPGLSIYCFNVPVESFQKFIKSIGSLQILNKKYYDNSSDQGILRFRK